MGKNTEELAGLILGIVKVLGSLILVVMTIGVFSSEPGPVQWAALVVIIGVVIYLVTRRRHDG
jgi:hypothetical protein